MRNGGNGSVHCGSRAVCASAVEARPSAAATLDRMLLTRTCSSSALVEYALVDAEIGLREAAEDDLVDRRMLVERGAHRFHGHSGRLVDRIPVDPRADAREGERAHAVSRRDLDRAPVA